MAAFDLPGDRTWRLCETGYAGEGRWKVKGVNLCSQGYGKAGVLKELFAEAGYYSAKAVANL